MGALGKMNIGNENFQVANGWLGWGNPKDGLWFIGVEEGAEFNDEILRKMRGKRFMLGSDSVGNDWPVANKVAQIVAKINGQTDQSSIEQYRDAKLCKKEKQSVQWKFAATGKAGNHALARQLSGFVRTY